MKSQCLATISEIKAALKTKRLAKTHKEALKKQLIKVQELLKHLQPLN